MSNWHPFDTAPKDGRCILIGGHWKPYDILPGGQWVATVVSWSSYWSDPSSSYKRWLCVGGDDPTRCWNVDWKYWMDIPAPPEDVK